MGWGSSTRRGGGRKVHARPRKFILPWVLKEGTWDVPGNYPGCPGPLGIIKNGPSIVPTRNMPKGVGDTIGPEKKWEPPPVCKCVKGFPKGGFCEGGKSQ